MIFDDLIQTINESGRLVNNLCQLDNRRWRASLRDNAFGYSFAEAETPIEALIKAAQQTERIPLREQSPQTTTQSLVPEDDFT